MYFENNYIIFSSELIINSISNYVNIMTKFINIYIKLYKQNYKNNNFIIDSILYSKYYLYFKIKNCIYDVKIMEIINNIDYYYNNQIKIN